MKYEYGRTILIGGTNLKWMVSMVIQNRCVGFFRGLRNVENKHNDQILRKKYRPAGGDRPCRYYTLQTDYSYALEA
jgi:hypothetical protein